MKPIVIIAIAFVLLISSVTPYANAEPLQIIQECTNKVITLKISDSEGPVENVSVYIYREIGLREYEGKVVTDENGKAKITNTSRTNAAKVTKGGYNDTLIFLECLPPKTNVISEPTVQKIPDIPTPVPLEGIPDWVKNTVGWWADGQLKDEEFVNSVGFLIKHGIITLPQTESVEGVSSDMIFNLLPNDIFELVFDGGVIPVPVSPVFLELTDPDGILTEKNQMIGAGGHYSFPLQFSDDSILGIYDVKLFFNHKLIKSESFKLEKPVSKNTTIPDWIKNNAKWWAHDKIDEGSFISGIQYLVNDKIIILETNDIGSSYKKNIPSSKYSSTHIDGFPDPLKTPEYYLDRYYDETEYRDWFDTQFPNTTIYEILGLIQNSGQIMKYIVPSTEFSNLHGIEKQYDKYRNELVSSVLDTAIETNYSTKSGGVQITVYKMTTPDMADSLFNSLYQDSDLGGYYYYDGYSSSEEYYFQDVLCLGERLSLQLCVYDKYLIFSDLHWGSTGDPDRKIAIIILDKLLQNISMIENKNYESGITPIPTNWQTQSVLSLFTPFTYAGMMNVDSMVLGPTNSKIDAEVKSTEGFSGLYCTQDEYDYVTMTGQFTNGPDPFSSIYFTLGILDNNDRIVATGIGSVNDIGPYQTKMFDARASWGGNYKECIIEVDTAYR
jgi:hypothetical protein